MSEHSGEHSTERSTEQIRELLDSLYRVDSRTNPGNPDPLAR